MVKERTIDEIRANMATVIRSSVEMTLEAQRALLAVTSSFSIEPCRMR
jgi:hypothetical protein